MPTYESHINENTVLSVWMEPIKSEELSKCFANILQMIEETDEATHILFDVTNAGNIPAQAPFLFIRSQMTKKSKLGRMAVIGTNPLAQVLAQMAVKMSAQNILFFATEAEAMNYLNGETEAS